VARNHRWEHLRKDQPLPEGHLAFVADAFDAAQASTESKALSKSEPILSDADLRNMIGQALESDDPAYAKELAEQLTIREFVNDTELL
jgi:hypothetical protein